MSVTDINNKRLLLQTAVENYKTAVAGGDPVATAAALEDAKQKGRDYAFAVGGTAKDEISGAFWDELAADPYFSDPIEQTNPRRIMVRDWLLGLGSVPQSPMIWHIDTSQNGANNKSFTLPIGPGSNVEVDWGDGNVETVTNATNHIYATSGTKTVTISGHITNFELAPHEETGVLLDISQWGTIDVDTWSVFDENGDVYKNLFFVQSNTSTPFTLRYGFTISALDAPTFKPGTSLKGLFYDRSSGIPSIGHWDVSNVVSMEKMFYKAHSFNQDLSGWNVGNVTNMSEMFYQAHSYNQPMDNWDTSKVTTMYYMFYQAHSLIQPLGNWDVSNVTNMSHMLHEVNQINYPLNTWNVSKVTDMSGLFYSNVYFDQSLSSWDVSNVTDMSEMFSSSNTFNQDISMWNISKVTNMDRMFYNASTFNQDLTSWVIPKSGVTYSDFAANSGLSVSNYPTGM